MDDYKKFYYAAVPYAKNTPYGEWVEIFILRGVKLNLFLLFKGLPLKEV